MKKTIIIFSVICVSIIASADLTSFRWFGGSGGLTDNSGVVIATGDATVLTYISDDAVIDFNPLVSLSASYGNDVLVYDTATLGNRFWSTYMTEGDAGANYVGKYAYSVVLDVAHAAYSGVGNVAEGTYYGLGAMSAALIDSDAPPSGTPQTFDPGSVQTTQQVIPEPAVASLLVVFGGGLMFAKRRFAKA